MNQPSEKTIATLDKINIASLFTFTAFSMFSISITQIAGFLGGMAWLFRTHLTGNWQEQRWPLGITFALFVLASLIAVVSAFDPSYSYKELRKLLEILIFFWVVNSVCEKRLRDSLSTLLIIAATLACFYSFYQGWKDGVGLMHRAEGTMSVYMTFAGIIMLAGLHASAKLLFRRPVDPLLLPILLIISVCLILTFTRQAWFGFLIGLFFLILVWRKKQTIIISGVIIAAILVYGSQIRSKLIDLTTQWEVITLDGGKKIKVNRWNAPYKQDKGTLNATDWAYFSDKNYWNSFAAHLRYRINSTVSGKDSTFLIRVALWKGGWEVFKDYPLTGCGFKCVDLIHPKYPDPTGLIEKLRGMHNNFIQLAVDTGLLGLLAWLAIWFQFFRLLYIHSNTLQKNPGEKWVICGSAAAVMGFLAGGFFESNFYDSEVAMVLYFIMALPFAGSKINGLGEENIVLKKLN